MTETDIEMHGPKAKTTTTEEHDLDSTAAISHDDRDESTAAPTLSTTQLSLLILSLFCGTFVMALDATIIGTAIPKITTEFNALQDIAWYGSSYLLTITAFQPTLGKLYRFMNIKVVFMACVVVFEGKFRKLEDCWKANMSIGSILCAAASSSAVFIIGRAIAGAGAAGLLQGSLAIITRTVRLQKRQLCISIVTSTFAVSVCIGPPIGGAFTEYVSWRWCFWINVPIGAVVLVLIFFLFNLPSNSQKTYFASLTPMQKFWNLDPLGALFIMSAVVCILLAFQWGGQTRSWTSVSGLIVAFGVLMGLFGFTQWKLGENATLPPWLFKQRSMVAGAIFMFLFSMPTYIYGYYLPIYFQAVKGSTAIWSGTQFLALAMPQIFAVVLAGAFVTMIGFYVPFIVVGTIIGIIGSGLFLLLDLNTSTALWAVYLVVCGVGTGFAINLAYTMVQTVLPEDLIPTGNAAIQFVFQLGAALSLSVAQTIFLGQLKSSAQDLTPSIPNSAIIAAGAYNLRSLAPSEEMYNLLRKVYMNALHDTYIFPLVVTGVALAATVFMENKNIKTVEKEGKVVPHDDETTPGANYAA